ncbi:MAG TPA: DEAD/DEAH box helicase [Mycobacteriales bacterium]|nr:DEAD/DEAH box helicase [Mycobacteriales bacterium]
MDPLASFSPATRAWFTSSFAAPTAAQAGAWAAIAKEQDALVVAPTGSGKTLAAFLSALDRLAAAPPPDPLQRLRVLYVSPLKALAVDVERNLRAPLAGIRQAAARLGLPQPDVTVGVRSGDTPAEERRRFAGKPPDILITTPESLFLVLTSQAREALRYVDTVIVDEIHAMVSTKRGAHLALSLERLDALVDKPARRIGLSATVRPLDEVSRFLGGTRDVTIVNPKSPKTIELSVVVPVEDMTAVGADSGFTADGASAAGASGGGSMWPAVEHRIVELIRAHRSTIVFANSRRLAERLCSRLNEIAAEQDDAAAAALALDDDPTKRDPVANGRYGEGGRDHISSRENAGYGLTPPNLMGESSAFAQAGIGRGATGAPSELARAHHGSVSREQRVLIEEALKAGRLPAVVATSSLELGIDMGAVDLVIQVESPPSVASGLQRVGRAGHQVGAISRGVLFPKYRGDLVPSAVIAERMRDGEIESMRYPRNPLDVLAQQIVSMVAMDTWTVDELADVVRRAAPFATLPQSALEATLDMLSGRFPSDDFAELRPRIVWDRVTGALTPRAGAQRLAVTSGGTIPDRGLFGVFLVGEKASRVGELDEEMVYESRVGDVFLLGSSSWRIEEITHDRVLVSPAPGQPGKMPFWHGDAPGRPIELGRALGAFLREMNSLDRPAATARAQQAGLDEWAASNLVDYLDEQRQATGHLPDDRTILVERFRDELGDWRLCVHSPFGAQVNGPWAMALSARLRESLGIEVQSMHSDDGIVVRLPEADEVPSASVVLLDPDDVEQAVQDEVGGSALFASRFRECAARALLLPKRNPGKRTPLWQQRQRSALLLQVASQFGSFPVVLETMREVLQDVFDVPGLKGLMADVQSRKVRLVEVETPSPSPFARTLLFGYVGAFIYDGDTPLAERRAQALSLDSTLLAELLGQAELRELVDADALDELERELQRLTPERHPRDVDGVTDTLRGLGDLTTGEAIERGATARWLAELEEQRRAFRVRIAGDERWVAVEDVGRLRDALGVPVPQGAPEVFAESVLDPLGDVVGRYARTHGPFHAADVATRLGIGIAVVTGTLQRLSATGRVVQGEFRPGGAGIEWCDADVLRSLRRRSLAKLRKEVEPAPVEALARFLPAWQSIGTAAGRGADALMRAVEQLQGVPVPASALERLILPARVADYTPAMLDELCAGGEVLWAGAGALPSNDGWVALHLAETADLTLPPVDPDTTMSPLMTSVVEALEGGAALFFRSLSDRVESTGAPHLDDADLVRALWDLVWAGVVTNDTLAPVRTLLGRGRAPTRRRPLPGRAGRRGAAMPSRVGPPIAAGRWSLLPERSTDATRRAHALADVLLDRHGIVTRGAVMAERIPGGFAGVYPVLKAFEESGRCRRGYFVETLGAAQFAMPGAVDRMRAMTASAPPASAAPEESSLWLGGPQPVRRRTPTGPRALVLAASDPANPFGAALPWPERTANVDGGGLGHRPGRKAGALVVVVDGTLVLYVERGGKTLLTWTEDLAALQPAVDALALAVRDGSLGKLAVERADGEMVVTTPLGVALEAAGFRPTPRGLRLRA